MWGCIIEHQNLLLVGTLFTWKTSSLFSGYNPKTFFSVSGIIYNNFPKTCTWTLYQKYSFTLKAPIVWGSIIELHLVSSLTGLDYTKQDIMLLLKCSKVIESKPVRPVVQWYLPLWWCSLVYSIGPITPKHKKSCGPKKRKNWFKIVGSPTSR